MSVRTARNRLLAAVTLAAGLLAGPSSTPASAVTGAITEYPTFTPSLLNEMAAGPDGNLPVARTATDGSTVCA